MKDLTTKFDRFDEMGKGIAFMGSWTLEEVIEFSELERFVEECRTRRNELYVKRFLHEATAEEVYELEELERAFAPKVG